MDTTTAFNSSSIAENFGLHLGGSLSIQGWTSPDMRQRATPTRLELHRLKLRKNGGKGNLLQLDDLDPEEKLMVQKELVMDVRVAGIDFAEEGDELKFDQVYLSVLSEWGIMCPHPYSSVKPVHAGRAHVCGVCDCFIIGDAEAVKKAAP